MGSRRRTNYLRPHVPSNQIVAEVDDEIPGASMNTVTRQCECLRWRIVGMQRRWKRVGPNGNDSCGSELGSIWVQN